MDAMPDKLLAEVRQAILDDTDRQLLSLIHELKISQYRGDAAPSAIETATRLGWISGDAAAPVLTRAGEIAGDPIREYMFWVERGRTVHMADRLERFAARSFAGQKVLEIGSGFGCNLFSIAEYAEEAVGIDLEPQYAQFTPIFAELEGIEPPRIAVGPAEKLPFPDAYFDQVLILGSLQYMNITAAIAEAARVLRPGGIFVTVQGTFGQYLWDTLFDWSNGKTLKGLKTDLVTLAETLSYEYLGRRLRTQWDHSTARPVYPSTRYMRRQLEACGLSYDTKMTTAVDLETMFQGVRTGGPTGA